MLQGFHNQAGTQLFFGFVILMSYRAFYASSDAQQPMTLAEMASTFGEDIFCRALLDDPSLRRRIADNGHAEFVARYSLRPLGATFLETLESVSRRRRK